MGLLRNIRSRLSAGRPAADGPGAIPCRDIVEIVTSYLEGDLEPTLRARFEAHLAKCPDCTLYVDQMRQTIELMGATRAREDLPPELRADLQRVFEDWVETGSAR